MTDALVWLVWVMLPSTVTVNPVPGMAAPLATPTWSEPVVAAVGVGVGLDGELDEVPHAADSSAINSTARSRARLMIPPRQGTCAPF
jgi:hypothetical protein